VALVAAACLGLNVGAAPKTVMVHYMPWFVAEPYSSSWGWHWTMNHFTPNVINTNGQREIASWYYPLIGPYDSADPVVLEYHVLLMKLGGVDGAIVDWYGMDNYNDYAANNLRTLALFDYTRKAGLKFSLCYEDATIKNEVSGGFIAATSAVTHAQQTMLYVQTNFFNDPSFLRWRNQPVLLNVGPKYFTSNSQWVAIFSVLDPTNQPAFFTEDNRLPVGAGAFNWPPMWMSQTNNGVLSASQLATYLSLFEQKVFAPPAWPAYVSSAFPRFHDIYAQAGVSPSYGYLDDSNGLTFSTTLHEAMADGSPIVQVVTFNDFGEGTIVEPTVEYGYRDLGMVQQYRRQYIQSDFAYTTNDLMLATRLYNQRRAYPSNAIISAELDRTFTNIVSGNLDYAGLELTGLESNRPAIYNVSVTNGQLKFSIGGYLSASGLQVQTTSNLISGLWQTIASAPGTTNITTFIGSITPQAAFFRVRNAGP